jgi:hypothetical protein
VCAQQALHDKLNRFQREVGGSGSEAVSGQPVEVDEAVFQHAGFLPMINSILLNLLQDDEATSACSTKGFVHLESGGTMYIDC